MCKLYGNNLCLGVCPLHLEVVLVRVIEKSEPEEISDLANALDPQLRKHDDNEKPPTLLESGTGEVITFNRE